MSLAERIVKKYEVEENGCWIWTAATNASGYGIIRGDDGRTCLAHRMTYELLVGPIPDGLKIDHLCRVRNCVNPEHMEPVTVAENNIRGIAPALARQRAASVTHCPKGHEYTPENTRVGRQAEGRWHQRQCRTCAREYQRARRQRNA